MRIQLPDWGKIIWEPARYKVLYGGRGGAKSRTFGTGALIRAGERYERIFCGREIQRSIKDSVKRLLDDQIERYVRMKAFPPGFFKSYKTEIVCESTGSSFIFGGLRNNPESTIKSMEGVTIAWIEEAHTVSRNSLDILIPTIREANSEIWLSFNAKYKTDPVYHDFVLNEPPEDSIVLKVDFCDNPWFPEVLRKEMRRDRKRDRDKYRHIWLGETVVHSEAQIFSRVWREEPVPEPPEGTTLLFGADWGFSTDPAALIRCWISGRTLYIDYEAYGVGVEIDELPQFYDKVPGSRKWKIRADSSRPDTISYMSRKGFNIVKAYKGPGSIEDGIAFLRGFDIVVDPRCKRTISELMLYSYKIDPHTNEVLPIILDQHNHLMDCLRYAVSQLMKAIEDQHTVGAGIPIESNRDFRVNEAA